MNGVTFRLSAGNGKLDPPVAGRRKFGPRRRMTPDVLFADAVDQVVRVRNGKIRPRCAA
jgi:hypothetical protein